MSCNWDWPPRSPHWTYLYLRDTEGKYTKSRLTSALAFRPPTHEHTHLVQHRCAKAIPVLNLRWKWHPKMLPLLDSRSQTWVWDGGAHKSNCLVLITCSVSHMAVFMCVVRVPGVFLLGQQHHRQDYGAGKVTADFLCSHNISADIARTLGFPWFTIPESRGWQQRRNRKQKWRCRAGALMRLWKQPTNHCSKNIFLANARSLANKLDEFKLQIATNEFIRDSCILLLSDLAYSLNLDAASELADYTAFQHDRPKASSKCKGRGCTFMWTIAGASVPSDNQPLPPSLWLYKAGPFTSYGR